MKEWVALLRDGKDLDGAQMESAMRLMMSNQALFEDMTAFLSALADKGECLQEVVAAARVLREFAPAIDLSTLLAEGVVVDPVGTGGDGAALFNVSTAAAIMAAAAGVRVAKHGNVASSGASGSADVLREAGVCLTLSPEAVVESLKRCGFAFIFAQAYHQAMRHVAAVRRTLARRTVFNLLGPLASPARTPYQLLGVFDKRFLRLMVEAARDLGARRVIAVSSENGLDEFSVTHRNFVCMLHEDGSIVEEVLDPKDLGIFHQGHEALVVKSSAESLDLIRSVWQGKGPLVGRDMLALNAAAVLLLAGRVADFTEGLLLARDLMENGAVLSKLAEVVAVSQCLGDGQ